MPAYMIALVNVHDVETYKEAYASRSSKAIAKYGGKFIVRGGAVTSLEGPAETRRVVVVEFPDAETAKNFYNSPEYQEAISHRLEIAEGQFMVVEGVS